MLERGLDAHLPIPVVRRLWLEPMPAPADVNVAVERATGAFYFLLGVKRALSMLDSASSFVLMLRWDVVFYSPFRLTHLDSQRLYVANWCRATVAPSANQTSSCRGLRPFAFSPLHCSDTEGVPDFWLAGSSATMRRSLLDAADDYVEGFVQPKGCPGLHGILAGAVQRASEQRGVRLGRYLYHQLDYDFIRVGQGGLFDDGQRGNTSSSLWRVGSADSPMRHVEYLASLGHPVPGNPSVCPANLYYCGCETTPLPPVACTTKAS